MLSLSSMIGAKCFHMVFLLSSPCPEPNRVNHDAIVVEQRCAILPLAYAVTGIGTHDNGKLPCGYFSPRTFSVSMVGGWEQLHFNITNPMDGDKLATPLNHFHPMPDIGQLGLWFKRIMRTYHEPKFLQIGNSTMYPAIATCPIWIGLNEPGTVPFSWLLCRIVERFHGFLQRPCPNCHSRLPDRNPCVTHLFALCPHVARVSGVSVRAVQGACNSSMEGGDENGKCSLAI